MKRLVLSSTLVASVLCGCATTYLGAPPNFSLSGKEAETEIRRFELQEGYWLQGYYFQMGAQKDKYKIDSMEPLIREISPSAGSDIQTAKSLRTAQTISLAIAVGALLASSTTRSESTKNSLWAMSLAGSGTSIAMGFIEPAYISSAAGKFNRDLRQRFGPRLTWVSNF